MTININVPKIRGLHVPSVLWSRKDLEEVGLVLGCVSSHYQIKVFLVIQLSRVYRMGYHGLLILVGRVVDLASWCFPSQVEADMHRIQVEVGIRHIPYFEQVVDLHKPYQEVTIRIEEEPYRSLVIGLEVVPFHTQVNHKVVLVAIERKDSFPLVTVKHTDSFPLVVVSCKDSLEVVVVHTQAA